MPFDDDDNPHIVVGPPSVGGVDGAAAVAEEAMEDEMPDYKLFMSMFDKKGVSSKTIRKGEKDFESHGTRAQDGVLESSRRALEDVLSYTRVHRGDGWVRGWYMPDFWEASPAEASTDRRQDDDGRLMLRERVVVVEHERGSWTKDIGRSVPAGVACTEAQRPGVGRLWLLPEEALHMVERGTLDLWWPYKDLGELSGGGAEPTRGPDDYEAGVPLSLEAAYSLLLGEEDGERGRISLPRYQVFTHLKRGGFHVLRASEEQASGADTTAAGKTTDTTTLLQWLLALVGWGGGGDARPQAEPKKHSFGPLVSPGLYRAYRPVYEQLSLLPRHRPQRRLLAANAQDVAAPAPQSPYKVFFHVWKSGGAPFSKRSPPAPNFRIAVTDADLHGVPTLAETEALLASTPADGPEANPAWKGPGRLYQRLKHGHRNVLVAVVDRGLVNYMRLGEGAFGEERLYERLDARRGGRGGGGKRGRGRGRGRGGRGRGRGR
ncbi:hypothetical protein ISF_02345 [Cordyceps fumosorosea ARSEF 2679]|uniref:tRNA-splicing endonuclease subunit Sen54 N-terminal domain-containing protein n=1 Tax=Cordyceps fumosorosea (strain ARSEF 2679) TaxID=1081104 RepID=A0A168BP77_CORFA|nr:hypothetical protein ISF_02345 [Cordyceps fumosorosea ARSEF 2679]OAA70371.1 hypothetical protein ISF_02345 [Cordyceps fumosorosea ARSEF 2679]